MAKNKALLGAIVNRDGCKPDLDTICSGLMRCVAKAEAYDMAHADHLLGFQLEIIEERLNEIVAMRDALVAAKGAA